MSSVLDAVWESDPQAGRPPRHLYRLTGTGVQLAGELADQLAGEWVVDRVVDRAGGRAVTTDPLGAAGLGGAR